jgi:hypothetical protein
MLKITKLIRPIMFAVAIGSAGACSSNMDGDWGYYPNHYPWYYNDYGAYTIVGRPRSVIDGWTTRTWGYSPYRGYAISRHSSPVIVHTATKDDVTLEVLLTEQPEGTRVEVRARRGEKLDKDQARVLMGQILHEYR